MSASQILICIFAAVLLFWAVGAYNRLVGLRNDIGRAFTQVDTQIKRRHELIPLLAEAARPGAAQADVLDAACAACHQARSALDVARAHPCAFRAVSNLSMAENVLDTTRARLLDLLETQPGTHTDASLRDTATELNTAENKLAYAREMFNAAVADYNDAVRQFPTSLLSSLYGFSEAARLQAPQTAATARNT